MLNTHLGTLELILFGAALTWLAYAGYRLWTAVHSPTARWVGVGFIVLAAFGLFQSLLE